MWPHPIPPMETLWRDRNRKVLANETRQQRLSQLDETPATKHPHQPCLVVRMLDALGTGPGTADEQRARRVGPSRRSPRWIPIALARAALIVPVQRCDDVLPPGRERKEARSHEDGPFRPGDGHLLNQTDCPDVKGYTTMLRKRMLNVALLLVLVTGTVAFGLARSAPVAGQDDADTQAKIENAMSAAPSSVSAQRDDPG